MQRIDFKRIKSGDYYPHKILNAFIFGIIPAILIYYYRRGGIVDGYAKNDSLRDLNVWLTAGSEILRGNSPYNDPGHWMKSGSLTTTIYGILGEVLPNMLLYIGSQVLTFVGIWMFIRILFPGKFDLQRIVFLITVLSSCFRENLVNIQLTGHILFLLSIGVHFVRQGRHLGYDAISGFSFILALDLKPNICVAFIIAAIIMERRYKIFIWMASLYICGYTIISIRVSENLFLNWMRVLRVVSTETRDSNLFGSVSIWQTLNENNWINNHISFLSAGLFSIILILIIRLALRKNENSLYISIWAPFFYSFFQYYSFTPIFILAFGLALQKRKLGLGSYIILSLVITTNINSMLNIALLVLASIILIQHLKGIRMGALFTQISLSIGLMVIVKFFTFSYFTGDPERISAVISSVLSVIALNSRKSEQKFY